MISYRVDVSNEKTEWFYKRKHHREDGPAIEYDDGTKAWCINGEYHRDDGPAIEYGDGTNIWYKHGVLHRSDGPAIEWSNGYKEWYINGIQFSGLEYINEQKIKTHIKDLETLLGRKIKISDRDN